MFAVRRIEPGERLAAFGGAVMTATELADRDPGLRRLSLQIDEDLYLVSVVESLADWFNHGCDPNAGLQGQLSLVALRAIEPGEEVVYDYAMTDGSAYDEFECACGSQRCRGRVSGDDWRLPELWHRYGTHFSPYLLSRIDSLRRAGRPRLVFTRTRALKTSRPRM